MCNEALIGQRYKDEILRPIVVSCAAAIGEDFMLMNDNYRTHCAHLLDDFLFEEGMIRMEWSTYSMDMKPIVHVWNILGRRDAGRLSLPQTLLKRKRALLKEWRSIPQLLINNHIDSIPQTCSMLLSVSGNHTPY